MKNLILFIFMMCHNIAFSQDMTVDETIKYINKQISVCSPVKVSLGWEQSTVGVSKDGEIIFYETFKLVTFGTITTNSYRIKANDINLYSLKGCDKYTSGIQLKCKYGTGDCVRRKFEKSMSNSDGETSRNLAIKRKDLVIFWSQDCEIGEKICNALIHLIDKVKTDPKYSKSSNPNDPFDKPVVIGAESNKNSSSNKKYFGTSSDSPQYQYDSKKGNINPKESKAWEYSTAKNSIYYYKQFIKNYPNSIYLSTAKEKIVDLEVDRIMKGSYGVLPQMQKTSNGTYSSTSAISLKNNTSYTLTVRYSGSSSKKIVLSSSQSQTVYLSAGTYRVAASVNSGNVKNYAGTSYISGGNYSSEFYISN